MSRFILFLFLSHNKIELIGITVVHVGDLLCTGNNSFINFFQLKLRNSFSFVKKVKKNFGYLGLDIMW